MSRVHIKTIHYIIDLFLPGTHFLSMKRRLLILSSIGKNSKFSNMKIGDGLLIAACACVNTDVDNSMLARGVLAKITKKTQINGER